MTTLTISSSLNGWSYDDFLNIDFDAVSAPSLTSSAISGYVEGIYFLARGYFTYNSGELTGGRLDSIHISYGGSSLASITDLGLDLNKVAYASDAEIERMIFGGNDVFFSDWTEGATYATGGGNDRITLGAGDDFVDGGNGVDTFVLRTAYNPASILMESGQLVIKGAMGRDVLNNVEILEFSNKSVAVKVGSMRDDVLTGDAQDGVLADILFGDFGNDRISGGKQGDRLFGNGGADKLFGGAGSDMLNGGAGKDVLKGGSGADILRGGDSDDRLLGGTGDDTLTGGSGRDKFIFTRGDGHDRITDFEIGRDTIVIDRGASDLSDLEFTRKGADVLVHFANVTILVEDVTVADLKDAANFDF